MGEIDVLSDLHKQFAALTAELQSAQSELSAIYRSLAEAPDRAAEAAAASLRERRDALLLRWGEVALRWISGGGEVALLSPPSIEEAHTEELHASAELPDDDEGQTDEIPATNIDLARLREAVLGPRWTQPPPNRIPNYDPAEVQALLLRVGGPKEAPGPREAAEELSRLAMEVDGIDSWRNYPRTIQRALLGIFAARLRYLQDELPATHQKNLDRPRLSSAFPYLTRFSEEAQPGFVKGLGRTQVPERGSWIADAQFWWEELETEVGESARAPLRRPPEVSAERALDGLRKMVATPDPDPQAVRSAVILALDSGVAPDNPGLLRAVKDRAADLEGDGRLKAVRRAPRQLSPADADDEETLLQGGVIPSDWPHRSLSRGKVAVMVGGDLREPARQAIQDALEFSELTWESGYDIRAVQALAARINRGGVGFVIFLRRFISHKITDILLPACKSSEIPWIMVEHGYGLTQVRIAVERYLGGSTPG